MLRTQGHYSAVITIAFGLLFTTLPRGFRRDGWIAGNGVSFTYDLGVEHQYIRGYRPEFQ